VRRGKGKGKRIGGKKGEVSAIEGFLYHISPGGVFQHDEPNKSLEEKGKRRVGREGDPGKYDIKKGENVDHNEGGRRGKEGFLSKCNGERRTNLTARERNRS